MVMPPLSVLHQWTFSLFPVCGYYIWYHYGHFNISLGKDMHAVRPESHLEVGSLGRGVCAHLPVVDAARRTSKVVGLIYPHQQCVAVPIARPPS